MKRITFLFALLLAGCNSKEQINQDTIPTRNSRMGNEIGLLTYSIPPKDGIPVSSNTLSQLRSKGLPTMETDILQEKKQKTWQQMDSLFTTIYPSITDEETKFVFEEHMAQIILNDFGLLMSSDPKTFERIAFYIDILHRNKGVHAGHIYLGLLKLKGFWPEQKIKEYSRVAYERVEGMLTRKGDSIMRMKQQAEKNLKNLPPQERSFAEKSLERIFRIDDEQIYFSAKLKLLSE